LAEAKRRGYGEDGIYFDHRDDCRDSADHQTCDGFDGPPQHSVIMTPREFTASG
jgi:hypothetical protein